MGPEQAEWYFSVVTAQNVRTLPHLVTVAVETAAALAEGAEDPSPEGAGEEAPSSAVCSGVLAAGAGSGDGVLSPPPEWPPPEEAELPSWPERVQP